MHFHCSWSSAPLQSVHTFVIYFMEHSSLHPLTHPSTLNVPTLPVHEFFSISLIPLLSIAFSPFPLLFLLLSPLIYLNHPPGENRSPPQSGTNCFVRFMNPEPNPDKRTLVRTAVLFVFAWVICFCLRDCTVIKVFIVLPCCSCGWRDGLKLHSTSKLSQIWSRGQMARNAVGTNEIRPNCSW